MSEDHFDPATCAQWVREEIPSYDDLQESVATATEGVTARSVLDLGTGTGETLARVLPRHPSARAIGVDESEGILGVAQDALAGQGGARVAPRRPGPLHRRPPTDR